jgi:lysophospholipase L1-like esterase
MLPEASTMIFIRTGFFILIMTTILSAQTLISPGDPGIRYMGRVDRSLPDRVMFDWPGITIQAVFAGTTCGVALEGVNYYDAFVDGVLTATFQTRPRKATFTVAQNLSDRNHRLLIVKRSESPLSTASFFGLLLDKGKTLAALPEPMQRKIEFIGDSYTAGFANEYLNRECPAGKEDSIILAATNAHKAFGPLVARAFGADYHLIAMSGKGLLRNYNGIDKGRELPVYYDRTLIAPVNDAKASSRWDFSQWKADVAVIAIGINDFQADPPYSDSAKFDATYSALIERVRKLYPGVKVICCATKVWPIDALIPHIKAIVEQQKTGGHDDVRYFEYVTGNGALYGHPHIYDHQTIADGLIPVVAEATGWRRTDMVRGK